MLVGVPTTVEDGLGKGDSMIFEEKLGPRMRVLPLTTSELSEDGTVPGTGKEGESTIMPGICIGRFSPALCEGPEIRGGFEGTAIGVPMGE